MIAREDAQTTGVDRQALGQPELGREVAHARTDAGLGGIGVQVPGQLSSSACKLPPIPRITGGPVEPHLIGGPQQEHRVVIGGLPTGRVQPPEQSGRLMVPGPTQVEGQIVERRQCRRDRGNDGEDARRFDHMYPS